MIFYEKITQSIVDSIDSPILFINSEYNIVLFNRFTEKFLRSSDTDIIGLNIYDEHIKSLCTPLCLVILRSISYKLENQCFPPSQKKWIKSYYNKNTKSKEYYQIKLTPVFDDTALLGHSVTIVDVSQQVRLKSYSRINRSFNKGVLAISRDPIFTFDSELTIIGMNSCAKELFLDPSNTYAGKKIDDLIHIKNKTTSNHFIINAINHKKTDKYQEINILDKFGKEHFFEVSAGKVKLENNTFYIAIFHNTTIRKKGEKRLHLELNQANKQNEAKSTFLAVMSHEMRTPLIGILGVHEILQDTNLDEEQIRYLDIATASSRTLLNLINGILDFSKIEAGKLELEMLLFSPEEVVNQVVEILATSAFKKGICLQTFIDRDLPAQIISDPVRLHQVLMNLINNAIKFTETGGIAISVIKSIKNPNQLIFEVKDTGIGIPSDKLNTLFDEFTQVESSTHRRYGGTGLGLAISNRLVTLLGGELKLSSEPGIGSKFWFTLQPTHAVKAQIYQPPKGLDNIKILLVDNSLTSSSMLLRQLQSYSISVTHVNSLDLAFQRLNSEEYKQDIDDIVIVNLFKIDGDLNQFCLNLKHHRVIKNSRFILLGPPDSIRETKSLYDDVFASAIPLPIRRTTLLQRIKLLLDKGVDDYVPQEHPEDFASMENKETAILIVDDSSTNRIVTESMLNRAGYSTCSATNGKEAIAVLQQTKIDLVLMDLSMPVMDGIQATMYIRTLPAFRNLTIIALTATALQEEIDACYHAGMNDYLGKPFTKQTLLAKLSEWATSDSESNVDMNNNENTSNSSSVNIQPSCDDSLYIDLTVLSQMADDLPSDLLPEMINLFVAESVKRIEQIEQLLTCKDYLEIGNQSHALKGSAATFGATQLVPLAEQLEYSCKQGHNQDTENTAKQVIEVGRKTLDAYHNHFILGN